MNPKEFIELKTQLENVESVVIDLEKKIAALKIDHQLFLRANKDIAPGIACKVAYDAKGLIIGFQDLAISDIPELPISRITNLDERLREITEKLAELQRTTKDIQKNLMPGVVKQTGTKVNVDANGRVISVSDLIAEDIPTLPISKIDGLIDILESLRTSVSNTADIQTQPVSVKASTAKKITMNDIPNELLTRINELESRFADYAPVQLVTNISKSLSDKIDANPMIRPGKYTKVSVDSKGIVTNGGHLELSDLPDLSTVDIKDLDRILRSKADRSDLNDIMTTLSTLVDSDKKIGDVLKLGAMIGTKAEDSEVKDISRQLQRIQSVVGALNDQASGEMVMQEFKRITGEVSAIAGRVTALEKQKS